MKSSIYHPHPAIRMITFDTDRLRLRPFREADLADWFSVLGDPETMIFYSKPYGREQVLEAIHKNIRSYERDAFGWLAVIMKDTERLIGHCGITLQNIDGTMEHEVGFGIAKENWGQGIAPEAARVVRDYAFRDLGLQRLCCHMASDHHQSRRVAEKIGISVEKEFRNPRNRNYLTTVYAMSKEEWLRQLT